MAMVSAMATRASMVLRIQKLHQTRSIWIQAGIHQRITFQSCRSDICIRASMRCYSTSPKKSPSEPITYSHPPEPPASLEKKRGFFDPLPSPSPRPEQKNILIRIWLKAKEFFIFYKDGIKQINTNRIQVNRIRKDAARRSYVSNDLENNINLFFGRNKT